jgi:hypothetical protein
MHGAINSVGHLNPDLLLYNRSKYRPEIDVTIGEQGTNSGGNWVWLPQLTLLYLFSGLRQLMGKPFIKSYKYSRGSDKRSKGIIYKGRAQASSRSLGSCAIWGGRFRNSRLESKAICPVARPHLRCNQNIPHMPAPRATLSVSLRQCHCVNVTASMSLPCTTAW